MSMFVISGVSLGTVLMGVEILFLLCCRARSSVALSLSPVCPPGWYMDNGAGRYASHDPRSPMASPITAGMVAASTPPGDRDVLA